MVASGQTIGSRTFPALGTFASLLITDAGRTDAACALLSDELQAIDLACSRFRADSEIWRVNHARGHPVRISPLLAIALSTALTAAQITGGDVDPTCGGPLVRLGYDRDFASARQRVGLRVRALPAAPMPDWQTVELDAHSGTVRVPSGVLLDLGATAKALAADRAAERISADLRCGVLVNLGGDIRVAGEPPEHGWPVDIVDDATFDAGGDQHEPSQTVMIRDGGLATSSTLVRSWQRGGTSLHHIIDPGTGLPADSCWRTVSVCAATCVDANTASTAAIVRGERATGWLAGLTLPARLVRHDGSVVLAGDWPAPPQAPGPAPRGPEGPQRCPGAEDRLPKPAKCLPARLRHDAPRGRPEK